MGLDDLPQNSLFKSILSSYKKASAMSSAKDAVLVCSPATPISCNGVWSCENPLSSALPLLTFQIALVVIATRIIHALIKPLRQPKVVADILGGVVLGPSVLGRSKKFREIVFPQRGKLQLDTTAMFGLLYFIFVIGVRMDPLLIKQAGKRELWIGVCNLLFPMLVTAGVQYYLRDLTLKVLKTWFTVVFMCSVLSMTSFSCIIPVLCDLHLLNSELGRLSSTAALLSDIYGWFLIVSFAALGASTTEPMNGLWVVLSVIAVVVLTFFLVRPMALRVVSSTPEGQPVEQIYVFFVLVGVLLLGFMSEVIGTSSFNGALLLGLVIPVGQPLGAALVEKLDSIITGLFMPLYYAASGLKMDVFSLEDAATWGLLYLIVVTACLGKILGTLLPALFYKVPFRDAVALSLFMNSKGILEIVTFNFWLDTHVLDTQSFTTLMLSILIVTAIVTPLTRIIYEPSRRYVVNKRRTIQHSKPDSELRILACLHGEDAVPAILQLAEATISTQAPPLYIVTLHLVELVGCFAPTIIDHKANSRRSSSSRYGGSEMERIANAFRNFEQRHSANVRVHPLTTIAPYDTMHDDICTLALHKSTSLVILPFHKQPLVDGGTAISRATRMINQKVLAHAVCSVGVLVHRMRSTALSTFVGNFSYSVAIFFFGGDDDREALALTGRMAKNPGVTITVMRFIWSGSINDHSRERKLDVEALEEFKTLNASSEGIFYQESVVSDSEEIVSAIRNVLTEDFDLVVVGMRHSSNPLLMGAISDWAECPELGFVGDLLASTDLEKDTPVLVIRQQISVNFPSRDAMEENHRNMQPRRQVYATIPSLNRTPLNRIGLRLRSPQP